MSVTSPEELVGHDDHEIVIVSYAGGENVAVECTDCNEVLTDANRPGLNGPDGDESDDLYRTLHKHLGHDAEIADGGDRAEIRCADCDEQLLQLKS